MTMPADVDVIVASEEIDGPSSHVSWTPVVLGALVTTALSSIMLAFAVSVGLGVSSAAPTWRDASASLALLSGLYLIIQAVISLESVAISQAGHASAWSPRSIRMPQSVVTACMA